MKEKKRSKRDIQSHHPFSFLVLFSNKKGVVKKALVNARDEKNAIRIAFNRLCRQYPSETITRARVADCFNNRIDKVILEKNL